MNELERMLVELGRTIREPNPPAAARRAAAHLRREQLRPHRPRIRLGVSLGLAASALVAAAVVPVARTAVLRFFHIGGVTIERVDNLPPVSPRGPLAPGRDIGLRRAQTQVSYTLLVPKHDPAPTHAFYYRANPPGGQVTLVYGPTTRPRLLVTEFIGGQVEGPFDKKVNRRTPVEHVRVDGQPGIWLGGAKHAFSFLDSAGMTREPETRLAGHTLIWQRGPVTLRLEGDLGKAEAIRLAASFEPATNTP